MKFQVKTNRFVLNQTKQQAYNTDTILLANYIKIPKNCQNILDVGTGSGILLLDLAMKTKANIYGIEYQENRYLQAKENILLNNLNNQVEVIHGDFNNYQFNKKFDLIISNPPFFKVHNNERLSHNEEDLIARHEVALTLESLIINVSKNLKNKGYFYMIHRPDRISEIIELCKQNNMVVKKIKFIHPYLNKNANHVLITILKNGNEGVIVEKPLILYEDKHQFTKEMLEIIGEF